MSQQPDPETVEGAMRPAPDVPIVEIFGPVVQGEGPVCGVPTVFVRVGGCDYTCAWCDTLYAVKREFAHQWTRTSPGDILAEVMRLTAGVPILVTLSGGNPALFRGLSDVVTLGQSLGYTFAAETQGTVRPAWLARLDQLVISPKPPSSGMPTDWDKLRAVVECGAARVALKVVVFDDADYAYARRVKAAFLDVPLYLQPGNWTHAQRDRSGAPLPLPAIRTAQLDRLRWLQDKVLADGWYAVTVLPQLHVLVHGNLKGV